MAASAARIAEVLATLRAESARLVSAIQSRGELAAFVYVADALDPRSAVRAGVELARLLWVRPESVLDGLKAADWILEVGGFGVVVLYLASTNVGVVDGEARLSPSARTRMVRGEAPWHHEHEHRVQKNDRAGEEAERRAQLLELRR